MAASRTFLWEKRFKLNYGSLIFLYIRNTDNPCVEAVFKILKHVDFFPKDVNEYRASINNLFVSFLVVNAMELGKLKVGVVSVLLCKLCCIFLVCVNDEFKDRESKECSLHIHNSPQVDQIKI